MAMAIAGSEGCPGRIIMPQMPAGVEGGRRAAQTDHGKDPNIDDDLTLGAPPAHPREAGAISHARAALPVKPKAGTPIVEPCGRATVPAT
jgi:hypothetical protein